MDKQIISTTYSKLSPVASLFEQLFKDFKKKKQEIANLPMRGKKSRYTCIDEFDISKIMKEG